MLMWLTHSRKHKLHVLACTHFAATMPVDVVKVRMQYAGADGNKLYNGISDCIVKTAKVARARVHLWDWQCHFYFVASCA
jgi:hypothetical protein